MAARRRLDTEVVRRGLAESRESARRLILEGRILVSGAVADKAARQVDPAEDVRLVGPKPRFVSRAGQKLEAALDGFDLAVAGLDALDAGSSTGGFTDCLLQRGARSVVAVDVGTNQLHERLRADPRVTVREQTDVRRLEPTGSFGLVVGDLSFISLKLVLPVLLGAAAPGASLVLLIKPQFEAGAREASRGKGIIRDPAIWLRVLNEIRDAVSELGGAMLGVMPSPITGTAGNVEFVGHFVNSAEGAVVGDAELAAAVAAVGADLPVDTEVRS